MGCCLSTNKHSKFHQHSTRSSRAPPPLDVETVKEVLSEIPNLIKIEEKNSPTRNSFKFSPQRHILEDPNILEMENISTTTFEDNDDNDVYRRRKVIGSPTKFRSWNQFSGELQTVRKSPARCNQQSPGRDKLAPERNGRETGFRSTGRNKTGSGMTSAGRSRSPAKRMAVGGITNEVGRSLSGRKTGMSQGQVGSDLRERVQRHELRYGQEREQSGRFGSVANNDESFGNPLVSLECFIFL